METDVALTLLQSAACSCWIVLDPRAGQVVLTLTLKTPYQDGTTHLVMSLLEFMQCLVALVPRPRLNLIRFHGVLALIAKLRAEIIPDGKKSKPTDANDDVPHSPASLIESKMGDFLISFSVIDRLLWVKYISVV